MMTLFPNAATRLRLSITLCDDVLSRPVHAGATVAPTTNQANG